MAKNDEKNLNLDEPRGLHYYHHHLQKVQQLLSPRPVGTGGIMIWRDIG